ncbi:MAG TPA: aldehyde ferredoxin oxidoreductase C-terminal domain-containing protein, partial [Methanolinea sp.]|nr:aldehyde ferredoxin oxidoreductase C-terminal domain-containing protein [Methanolinea sp.]
QEMSFNVRQGMTRADDRMPQRPEVAGTSKGKEDLARHQVLLDAYYSLHGCTPLTGIPNRTELERLGLRDVADSLHMEN